MKTYVCEVCKKEIENYRDGNFVKVKDGNGELIRTVPVHKGECDDKLCAVGRAYGLNTNASMEISFFDNDEQREEYINGTFSMTDDEFYNKYFNEDGTLKA